MEVLEDRVAGEVTALFAHSSVDLFVSQVEKWKPRFAGLVDSRANAEAKGRLHGAFEGQWLESEEEIIAFAGSAEYDTQVAAVVGVEGFASSFAAFTSGKNVALANKESLVVGGEFFRNVAPTAEAGLIIPVDSEHSSLYRLLRFL